MIFVLWIIFSIAIGFFASQRGRGIGSWFIISLVASPVLAFIFLLALGKYGKSCPSCAETVHRDALKCKHCGSELPKTKSERETAVDW